MMADDIDDLLDEVENTFLNNTQLNNAKGQAGPR